MNDQIAVLQAIQDSEINFQIETFWDMGFVVKLGDDMNGIVSERCFRDTDGGLASGIEWLVREVLAHYPTSKFSCEWQGRPFAALEIAQK